MALLRFVVSRSDPDSGVAAGLFTVAYALRDTAEVSEEHRLSLKDLLLWFEEHLPKPERFNRSTSKGYYRRATKGISWFRDGAKDHIARMHAIAQIVEANGYFVHIVHEQRVGFVVYEDDFQVIAEPFADTRTGQ